VQKQIVLKNCGRIDPGHHVLFREDGFRALEKAKEEMTPEKIIEEVMASELLGRVDPVPCGLKEIGEETGDEKFLICNADGELEHLK
jgi:NADH:ubiquinone oxidoreductase subunit F (NADH-binding)